MSTLQQGAAAVLLLGLVMYALFGGADFGGGIWTALARGPRASQQREQLLLAMGPVWETNHIWLVFVVVTLLTAFPAGFAALFIALMLPLVLVLVGLNFRGAAIAFSHFGPPESRLVGSIVRSLGITSALTPFGLGMAMTATATGQLMDGQLPGSDWPWCTPFTLVGGLIGVAICAFLAPIYMAARTPDPVRGDFRQGGIIGGMALGILTTLEIPLGLQGAPLFASRLLSGWGLACILLATLSGITTQLLLWRRHHLLAQLTAALTVTATITGFAAAMYPDLLIGQLSLAAAAAPRATLVAFFAVLPVGMLLLVPSLLFLYRTFAGESAPH